MADPPDDHSPTAVLELLRRVGVAGWVEPAQLPHNRRLTPGVWQVRDLRGKRMVLKHLRADRDRGETEWDRHWSHDDHAPRRWNYWARELLAYEHHLTDAYAAAGISAPACRGLQVDDGEAVLLLDWVDGQPGEEWSVDT